MKNTILVSRMGEVFKISIGEFSRFLESVMSGGSSADLDKYKIKNMGRYIDVTDLDLDGASQLYKQLKGG